MTETAYRADGHTTGPTVEYPTSDGQPMAETELHAHWMQDVTNRLRLRYADHPEVHVGSNLLLYWVEGDTSRSVSPDVYVTFGMGKALRDTYQVWAEGKAPDVVFEITSRSTRRNDLGKKKRVYRDIGVREYFLYDPYGEYLEPRLMGFRLSDPSGDEYVQLSGPPITSQVLDVVLTLDDEGGLVMMDGSTGQLVLTDAEQERERAVREAQQREAAETKARREAERAEREAERAEREAQRAEREAERAEREAEQRAAAEAMARSEAKRAEREAGRAEREAERAARLEARLRELEARLAESEDENQS